MLSEKSSVNEYICYTIFGITKGKIRPHTYICLFLQKETQERETKKQGMG